MKKIIPVIIILLFAVIVSGVVLQKTDAQVDIDACQKEYNARRSQCIADNTTCAASCGGDQSCEIICNEQRNVCDETAVNLQKKCLGAGDSSQDLPVVNVQSARAKTDMLEVSAIFGQIAKIGHDLTVGDKKPNIDHNTILVRYSSENSGVKLDVKFTPTKDLTDGSMKADLLDELPEGIPPLDSDFRAIQYFDITQSDLFPDYEMGVDISMEVNYHINRWFSVGSDMNFYNPISLLQLTDGDWEELPTINSQSDPYIYINWRVAHFSYFAIAEKLTDKSVFASNEKSRLWKVAPYLAIGLAVVIVYVVYRKKDKLIRIIKKEQKQSP